MQPDLFLYRCVCLLVLWTTGCVSVHPEDLFPASALADVNVTVTFEQIRDSPDSYDGTTVLLGGEVLAAKRLKDHTRLTILQLPLDTRQEPTRDRTSSKGRFIAIQDEFLDPATVPGGTRLTLLGKISGSLTEPLDETDYRYPILRIQHLQVWQDDARRSYAYYPYYPYYPYPYYYRPWIGPYWYY